jgi:myb proto-oncogene protein
MAEMKLADAIIAGDPPVSSVSSISNIEPTTARLSSKWTPDEDNKLMEAVRAHGAKDWVAIATLVPGRSNQQCRNRWRDALDPSIGRATARTGKWIADEDKKLMDAVRAHGAKDWEQIALLVPGRTHKQCRNRWRDALDPSTGRATAHTGLWTADDNKKLREAVGAHGAKNWKQIALLAPGRTKEQCRKRWRNIDPTTVHMDQWTADEHKKLREVIGAHGAKNWKAIASLVPDRTEEQCRKRWRNVEPTTVRMSQ